MKQLEDTDPMPWGKYRGALMQNIPVSYLHWLWANEKKDDKQCPVADYIRRNLSAIQQEYPDGIGSEPTTKGIMNINDMKVGDVLEIASILGNRNQETTAYEIGKNYFIRTVTHHYTGKLVEIHRRELVLVDAAWIADDGRFADAIKSESFIEVEPWPKDKLVIIGRDTIIDATQITKLSRVQK